MFTILYFYLNTDTARYKVHIIISLHAQRASVDQILWRGQTKPLKLMADKSSDLTTQVNVSTAK